MDLGYEKLGCYGGINTSTLNLDGEIMKVEETDFGSDLLTDYVIG